MMLISSKALPRVANMGSTSKARVGSVAFTFAQNLVRLGRSLHCRCQVDKITSEQLKIDVHRPQFDFAAEQHPRDACRLRPGIGVIEPASDTLLECRA
jgi:hypothetical protein